MPIPFDELGVVPVHHRLERERTVLAELDLAEEVPAVGVDAEPVEELERVDPGEVRLRHLLAAHRQVPVGPDLVRRLDVRGHQHRRPVDRVLPQDVLADHVDVRRPEPGEPLLVGPVAGGGDVVREGVEPDVRDVVGIPGQRDPPVEVRPADREVLEPAPDQRQHLVPPDLGLHGGWSSARSAPAGGPRRPRAGRSSSAPSSARPAARGSGRDAPRGGPPPRSRARRTRSRGPRRCPGRCRPGRCRALGQVT